MYDCFATVLCVKNHELGKFLRTYGGDDSYDREGGYIVFRNNTIMIYDCFWRTTWQVRPIPFGAKLYMLRTNLLGEVAWFCKREVPPKGAICLSDMSNLFDWLVVS